MQAFLQSCGGNKKAICEKPHNIDQLKVIETGKNILDSIIALKCTI
jgi:hypothetical protein